MEERYTKPQQGLYMSKDVDIKKLKKLILESKLAPCYPGDDEDSSLHMILKNVQFAFWFAFTQKKNVIPFLLVSLSRRSIQLTNSL